MGEITEDHVIDSVAEALQYVSYFHPPDFSHAMAHEREESPGARNTIAQILVNSRMPALGRRPICQDTGTANIFVKVGTRAKLAPRRSLQDIVDDAVRRASMTPIPFGHPLFSTRSSGV